MNRRLCILTGALAAAVMLCTSSAQAESNQGLALECSTHMAYIDGNGTNIFPTHNITRAEVAAIFCRLMTDDQRKALSASGRAFSDVPADAWYREPVAVLVSAGVLHGYPDGTFRPNQPITRGEYVAIATQFDGVKMDGEAAFLDTAGHWAATAITQAAENGWISGYPDGSFHPSAPITRAEAIVVTNRMLGRGTLTASNVLPGAAVWADVSPDDWYYAAVEEATNGHTYGRDDNGQEVWSQIVPKGTEIPETTTIHAGYFTYTYTKTEMRPLTAAEALMRADATAAVGSEDASAAITVDASELAAINAAVAAGKEGDYPLTFHCGQAGAEAIVTLICRAAPQSVPSSYSITAWDATYLYPAGGSGTALSAQDVIQLTRCSVLQNGSETTQNISVDATALAAINAAINARQTGSFPLTLHYRNASTTISIWLRVPA